MLPTPPPRIPPPAVRGIRLGLGAAMDTAPVHHGIVTPVDRYLPPAYVVRREGTVFTGVCLSTGGGGGVQVPPPPPPGGVWVPPQGGPGGYLTGYPPGRSGYPPRGGTRPGTPPGVPDWVPPRGVRVHPPQGGYQTGYPPGGVPS